MRLLATRWWDDIRDVGARQLACPRSFFDRSVWAVRRRAYAHLRNEVEQLFPCEPSFFAALLRLYRKGQARHAMFRPDVSRMETTTEINELWHNARYLMSANVSSRYNGFSHS